MMAAAVVSATGKCARSRENTCWRWFGGVGVAQVEAARFAIACATDGARSLSSVCVYIRLCARCVDTRKARSARASSEIASMRDAAVAMTEPTAEACAPRNRTGIVRTHTHTQPYAHTYAQTYEHRARACCANGVDAESFASHRMCECVSE